MRRADWLSVDARRTFAETVKAIESRTAAEVVVTVRDRSATYRHVDFGVGAVLALAMLLVYVYFPVTFHDDLAVPSVAVAFVAGLLFGSAFDGPKRLFVSLRERHAQVKRAAQAEVVEQRITATRARSGVLVYVSLAEHDVAVVPDIGIDVERMGEAWASAITALESCARAGGSPESFAKTLLAIGDPLAAILPIGEDDVNELPDEVVA